MTRTGQPLPDCAAQKIGGSAPITIIDGGWPIQRVRPEAKDSHIPGDLLS
jgi:hypothetical protein